MTQILAACYIEKDTNPEEQLSRFRDKPIQLSFFRYRDFWKLDHDRIKSIANENKVDIGSIHLPTIDVFHRDFLKVLEFLQEHYDQSLFTLHPQNTKHEKATKKLDELSDEILSKGISLAYENFPQSAKKWIRTSTDICSLDYPFLGLTFDTSHLNRDNDLMFVARKYIGKIRVVHLSDNVFLYEQGGKNKFLEHLPKGYGDLRLDELLDFLRIHYDGQVVLDYGPEYKREILADLDRVSKRLDRSTLKKKLYTNMSEDNEIDTQTAKGKQHWAMYYDEREVRVRMERYKPTGSLDLTFTLDYDSKGNIANKYHWDNNSRLIKRRFFPSLGQYEEYDSKGNNIATRSIY